MKSENVSIEKWGKDHWSTFAYIETCIVDGDGCPSDRQMRTDPDLHPGLYHTYLCPTTTKYLTRTKEDDVENHDDWSCLDDAEELGLLKNVGSGINRRYEFTDLGHKVASELRAFKARGGNFHRFEPSGPTLAEIMQANA